jgi:hypothetical protein
MMVHLHLPRKTVPMRLNLNSAPAMAASSVAAAFLIGSLATSVVAARRRALKRRQLRYRVADGTLRAIHAGLRRSIDGVDWVRSATLRR